MILMNLISGLGIGIGVILLIVGVLIILWGISVYNRLISSREFVRNSMGNIATQVE